MLIIYLPGAQETSSASQIYTAGTNQTDFTSGRVYVVQRGDSLWRIAAKVYGSGSQWRLIYEANRNVLRGPGVIYAGGRLLRILSEMPF